MRLIVKSKLPAAEKFEAWVFEEVLPTIRKTGKYEAPKVEPKIGSEEVNSVSARELYLDLGMDKSNWAKWSKSNIEENTFFENGLDWVGFVLSTNGNETRDFAVTIEFAKHIAMMAKTQRAHDYRNYFIECEKQAKSKPRRIDHLSPEVISVLKQARTVQLAMGMGKQQASRYAREL